MKRFQPINMKAFGCHNICLSGLVMLGGLVLSGCAPIPQAYPAAPQQQQWVNNVPQAAPLLPDRQQQPAAVQRYAASPVQRSVQKVRTAVPPTLQPAQQQARQPVAAKKAATRQAQQRQQSRRAPVSTYRPQTVRRAPPSVAPVEKREKRVAQPVTKKPVARARPVPTPVQSRPQQPAAAVQKKAPEVEVLDMSSTTKQQGSEPTVEKVVPPPPSYQNSPAVVILTKQANNQLVAGKKDQAASTLERALRIAPENPMLWLRLAEVNEQQGNKAQATSMAKKAIGLAPNDAKIMQRGSRLIN